MDKTEITATPPAFAPKDARSLPLHLVTTSGLEEHLARQPETANWLRATGFSGAAGQLQLLPGPDGTIVGAVFGMGDPASSGRTRFAIAKAAGSLPAGAWHIATPLGIEAAEEAALGWLLSGYSFSRYRQGRAKAETVQAEKNSDPARTESFTASEQHREHPAVRAGAPFGGNTADPQDTAPPPTTSKKALLVAPDGVDAQRIAILAASEWLTRDLINTPSSDLGPQELEQAVRAVADDFGATVTTVTGDDLLTQNFPMIHAVGRASPRAPRLIDLNWGDKGPLLTLVGKGVCFDTGGLDLKPSTGMLLMKKDMGGAATALGLARSIMALNLPIRLRLLIPAVENSVSGNAFRPKDILTSRKGLTVEVNNTDAEGRLVLADALALADEGKPDLVISFATLTGAARVAVGPDLAPFYCDDDGIATALSAAGTRTRDPVWRMPFWEPYEDMIEPGIADLDNAPSGGFAGSITAALFLRRFVAAPYLHFDIYGWQPSAAPARPKGGAGQAARAVLAALPSILPRVKP